MNWSSEKYAGLKSLTKSSPAFWTTFELRIRLAAFDIPVALAMAAVVLPDVVCATTLLDSGMRPPIVTCRPLLSFPFFAAERRTAFAFRSPIFFASSFVNPLAIASAAAFSAADVAAFFATDAVPKDT